MRRYVALLLFAVIAAAGCSSSSGEERPSTSLADDHNSRDETFASMMIPHHAQAVEMSQMADTSASNAQVKSLANRIEGAQQPEIDQMKAWLEEWGVPYDPAEHEGHIMPGMMTPNEMADLKKLNGGEFDRRFLEMMIRHHQGALDMVDEVTAKGASETVKQFAENMRKVQAAEIKEMQDLLLKL